MRSEAPPLLPIFRSRHQADLLTILLLHADQDYTLTELATRLGVAPSTLHREVQRLVEAAILSVREVGRSRLLRANTANRAVAPLTQLLVVTFGPHVVIAEEFARLTGVEEMFVYGSWAARYRGQPGPPPNDVDVLIVGTVDRQSAYEAADQAEQRLGFPVNVTIASPQRWAEASDPLIRQIKASPAVNVRGGDNDVHEVVV
jgi:AraC-like DNA-binding protein